MTFDLLTSGPGSASGNIHRIHRCTHSFLGNLPKKEFFDQSSFAEAVIKNQRNFFIAIKRLELNEYDYMCRPIVCTSSSSSSILRWEGQMGTMQGPPSGRAVTGKKLSHMFKCAVFDINPTYNH